MNAGDEKLLTILRRIARSLDWIGSLLFFLALIVTVWMIVSLLAFVP